MAPRNPPLDLNCSDISLLQVLLCKVYPDPVLEEKVGKCVNFKRYFDIFIVFEIFRGERIRHRSLICAFGTFSVKFGAIFVHGYFLVFLEQILLVSE